MQIELQAKLLGELDTRPSVNVLMAPEWQEVRQQIFVALAPTRRLGRRWPRPWRPRPMLARDLAHDLASEDVLTGVAIGQGRDPSALAVVEPDDRGNDTHYLARHLEQLPPGTPYPEVGDRLRALVAAVEERTGWLAAVFVDVTGLSEPVLRVLRDRSGMWEVRTVRFTHGDRRTVEGWGITLGKAWLVARLKTLLQCGQLHLPRTAEAEELARELLDYEVRPAGDANERYGAFRVGRHDDLVTALGLAVQGDESSWRRAKLA